MGKKYRNLKRKGNMIVFPHTLERLLSDGMDMLQRGRYGEAKKLFAQVLEFEPEDAAALGAYAYSLFELEEYEEALESCRKLLEIGPIRYLETMELYISILMQLRRYKEAEQTIEALIEEDVLPPERLAQFEQLQQLNERIIENTRPAADISPFKPELFIKLPPDEQERLILELSASSYQSAKSELLTIVGHPETDLLTKTYILFMLHHYGVEAKVEIRKFHYAATVSTLDLPDPVQSPKLEEVRRLLGEVLEKDPSRLEMAIELFDRHVYLIYPFEFDEYEASEIAAAYHSYLDALFSGEAAEAQEGTLRAFLIKAEQWFESRHSQK